MLVKELLVAPGSVRELKKVMEDMSVELVIEFNSYTTLASRFDHLSTTYLHIEYHRSEVSLHRLGGSPKQQRLVSLLDIAQRL